MNAKLARVNLYWAKGNAKAKIYCLWKSERLGDHPMIPLINISDVTGQPIWCHRITNVIWRHMWFWRGWAPCNRVALLPTAREGYVFTGICLYTGGRVFLLLDPFLVTGPMSFLRSRISGGRVSRQVGYPHWSGGHCHGRCAFYWNAFLFISIFGTIRYE